jgi:tRNA-splicing ligase RtcB
MNNQDLIRLGVPQGDALKLSYEHMRRLFAGGLDREQVEADIFNIVANPPAFFADELRAPLARAIYRPAFTPRAELAPWRQWGEGLEAEAVKQMANACALPVAVAGALMPDAHVGYGLPIGGVLATDNAVIPYAVGVDIACRMKLTVYERKANTIAGERDRLANIIADETRFGMGCEFKQRRQHDVMDEDWSVSPVTQRPARKGLEAARHERLRESLRRVRCVHRELSPSSALNPGEYLALLTHLRLARNGRAGVQLYSRIAMDRHEHLPKELKHLAWLSLDDAAGQEYWAAMNLMGPTPRQPRAHSQAHRQKARRVRDPRHREPSQLRVEGAPRGKRRRARLIVHRKGATPAGSGVLGVIPGSMASPGFVVRGKGEPSRCTAPRTCGPRNEPHQGDAVVHLGRREEAASPSAK